MHKKAILVVSFGTTYADALEKSIFATEERFREAFPEYEVRRAFTSEAVIEKLAEKYGLQVDGLPFALEKLKREGFSEVCLQPLYITNDKTFAQIKEDAARLMRGKEKAFAKMVIGRPLLSSLGIKDHPDDYAAAIEALQSEAAMQDTDKAVVLMCNGTQQLEYSVLQLKFFDMGIKNVFLYTAEGYPSFAGVLNQLQEGGFKEIVLAPFLLVGSEHVFSYLGDVSQDSAKSRLEAEGYVVSLHKKGLGENKSIQALFIRHLKEALQASEKRHGHLKKRVATEGEDVTIREVGTIKTS